MTHNNSRVILTIEKFRDWSKQTAIKECQWGFFDPEFTWNDYETSSKLYDMAVKEWYSFVKPSDVPMLDWYRSEVRDNDTVSSVYSFLREWIEEEFDPNNNVEIVRLEDGSISYKMVA